MEQGIQRFPQNYKPLAYPGPKNLKSLLGALFLQCMGWRVAGGLPETKKWVAIGAPHTSNWDFPLMVTASWVMGVRLRWMGKAVLFKGPWGFFMRALGGISVDRTQSNDMVQQMAAWFEKEEGLVVAIPPSGTRAFRDHWKTGFYFIAEKARVPIGLGVLDFTEKAVGFAGVMMPSGDIDQDFQLLQEFYAPIGAKDPSKKNLVQRKSKS